MNLKRIKYISIIGIFILCFPIHFLYEWFPNVIFSVLFPVNESIWEHMKILYSSTLVFSIIEYIILRKNSIKYNNFLFNIVVSSISSIVIFLLIFLPIYYKFGHYLFLSILIMFISIILSQIISYYILNSKKLFKSLEYISFIVIIITYIIFGYLTYNPPKGDLFLDTEKGIYGMHN